MSLEGNEKQRENYTNSNYFFNHSGASLPFEFKNFRFTVEVNDAEKRKVFSQGRLRQRLHRISNSDCFLNLPIVG